jgi:hypothetical protein
MYVTALGRRLTAGRCNRNTVFGGDTQGGDNPAVRAILAAPPPGATDHAAEQGKFGQPCLPLFWPNPRWRVWGS